MHGHCGQFSQYIPISEISLSRVHGIPRAAANSRQRPAITCADIIPNIQLNCARERGDRPESLSASVLGARITTLTEDCMGAVVVLNVSHTTVLKERRLFSTERCFRTWCRTWPDTVLKEGHSSRVERRCRTWCPKCARRGAITLYREMPKYLEPDVQL